jgi:acetolactate synthase I/II/III large subunit
MPLDVQAAASQGSADARAVAAPPSLRPPRPAKAAIVEAADALARARRPLILAGRGAVLADARGPLERLGDLLGALFATSTNGNGLFAGNPWSLGISGGFASPAAAELIGEADVVLAVGATLNMWTTRHGHILNSAATVIEVDADADAMGAHQRVDIAVIGDAAEAAHALIAELERRGQRPSGWRSAEVAARIAAGSWKASPYDDAGTATTIDPRTLSTVLDDLLPADRTVAVDSGHFMGYPAMYLSVPDVQGFVFTQAFQAVGLGLASAIGAAVARPDRLTVAALGDGGTMLALQELETVARLGLHMLIVVYNDSAYGAEVHHFELQGHPTELVRFPDVDFAALGRAVGLEGTTVRRRDDLQAVTSWLATGGQPALVLDAKVEPTVVARWLEGAFRGH